uniref:Secreted protein n=1 Tax=Romanomermis culicivorax TaxID=13658 RepID=A0A915JWK2_ROMCU
MNQLRACSASKLLADHLRTCLAKMLGAVLGDACRTCSASILGINLLAKQNSVSVAVRNKSATEGLFHSISY